MFATMEKVNFGGLEKERKKLLKRRPSPHAKTGKR